MYGVTHDGGVDTDSLLGSRAAPRLIRDPIHIYEVARGGNVQAPRSLVELDLRQLLRDAVSANVQLEVVALHTAPCDYATYVLGRGAV